MFIKILGAGAGGGLPQWNCNAKNSKDARNGHKDIEPRTQSSIAVSSDNINWLLLNASPDLRQQIFENQQLHPLEDGPVRNSPIRAVILTNGDVDHITGLICLREGHKFNIYASNRVLETLNANSIFNVVNPDNVPRHEMKLNEPLDVQGVDGPLDIRVTPFPVPGKVALYLEDTSSGDENFGTKEGDTIGLLVEFPQTGKSFYYIPGCAAIDEPLRARLQDADLLLFDGTLFKDDEMLEQGLMPKTGGRMGHMNMSGPGGSMAQLEPLNIKRKIYIHINNSNPALRKTSKERAIVEENGWEISYDQMEVIL